MYNILVISTREMKNREGRTFYWWFCRGAGSQVVILPADFHACSFFVYNDFTVLKKYSTLFCKISLRVLLLLLLLLFLLVYFICTWETLKYFLDKLLSHFCECFWPLWVVLVLVSTMTCALQCGQWTSLLCRRSSCLSFSFVLQDRFVSVIILF